MYKLSSAPKVTATGSVKEAAVPIPLAVPTEPEPAKVVT